MNRSLTVAAQKNVGKWGHVEPAAQPIKVEVPSQPLPDKLNMSNKQNTLLRCVRSLAAKQASGGLSDQRLLAEFLTQRSETSFAALVRRHGPMVLNVCRRVLRNQHDAEDAFQAAFLVFVREAANIRKQESVSSFLYSVAYHVAANMKVSRCPPRRTGTKPSSAAVRRPMRRHHLARAAFGPGPRIGEVTGAAAGRVGVVLFRRQDAGRSGATVGLEQENLSPLPRIRTCHTGPPANAPRRHLVRRLVRTLVDRRRDASMRVAAAGRGHGSRRHGLPNRKNDRHPGVCRSGGLGRWRRWFAVGQESDYRSGSDGVAVAVCRRFAGASPPFPAPLSQKHQPRRRQPRAQARTSPSKTKATRSPSTAASWIRTANPFSERKSI